MRRGAPAPLARHRTVDYLVPAPGDGLKKKLLHRLWGTFSILVMCRTLYVAKGRPFRTWE